MSRRNTYLLGGLAVVAGIAMLVFAIVALTSGGDDSSSGSVRNGTEQPTAPAPGATEGQGAARRLGRAPGFSAQVIQEGSLPPALRSPFARAARGGKLDMSELRGTPVVLHVWSTECAPCRGGTRLVEASWKQWGSRGVLFIGMHVNESAAQAAEPVLGQYELTYPAVWDRGDQIAKRYGVAALPQMFFISAGGDFVGKVVGAPSMRQLQLGVEAAKSGKPFGSEQGGTRFPVRPGGS